MEAARRSSAPVELCLDARGVGIPLFHAAWLFALGIVIAHFTWLRPAYLLIAIAPAALLCALAALRAQRIRWLPLGLLWCLLGVWCAEMQPQAAPEPRIAALSDGLIRTVEGTIIDAAPVRAEREDNAEESNSVTPVQRLDLRLSTIEIVSDAADSQAPGAGAVRLSVKWPAGQQLPAGFRCGDRIRSDVRLTQPEIYRDPGAWNRSDYLLTLGITSTATVTADHLTVVGTESSIACHVSGWQHTASTRILSLPSNMLSLPAFFRISDDDAAMLAAMVTGDRTYLTRPLRVGFERTGSFHMLVVSGLHLAIVAGFILWITLRLRLPRIPGTLITLGATFAYALFTGFATPVQRSLWMVTLFLMGRLFYRERNALNTIGFASLCLLAASPRTLFESSLQMTVLAVVSIVGIAAPLLESTIHPYLSAARDLPLMELDVKLSPRLAQFRVVLRMFAAALARATNRRLGWSAFPWIVRGMLRCVEALVVTCVAELAMSLPMAMYFHRITVFALPVNIFILPLLVLLVPAALIMLLLLVLSTKAALIPAVITAMLLHFGTRVVHLFGSMPFSDFRVPGPNLLQIAIFSILLGAAIALARHANSSVIRRHLAWATLAAAAIAVLVPRPVDHPRNALLVEAIDVGQGDSILLISPDGKTLLIDGGGLGGGLRQAPQNFDIGEEVVSPALWSRGIHHLDVVALSHAHSDHMGGLPAILKNFRPGELWVGNNPPVAAYRSLLEEAAGLGIKVRAFRAGDSASFGSAQMNVLAPFADYRPAAEPGNNDSLVLRVVFGDTSVLLEGDAEAPIEEAMLAESALQSTLLKVGHHGSATSTRPSFLERVVPQWAIISCGLHNHYGHPRAEVLEQLQTAHVRTFSTDIDGATCFELNGKNVSASVFCGSNESPIK